MDHAHQTKAANFERLQAVVEAASAQGVAPRLALNLLAMWDRSISSQMMANVLGAVTTAPEDGLEARIRRLYDELGDLVARSRQEPGLESEIANKREQLRTLQVEEARLLRQRAEARRHLKPGEGYAALEQAERLLAG